MRNPLFLIIRIAPINMLNRNFGLSPFQSTQRLFFKYSVFFVLLGSSCVTTRFQETTTCAVLLKSGDRCLLPWLPANESEILLRQINSQFQKKEVEVRYMPAEEWNLRAAGVSNSLDSAQFASLKKLGYSHFLLIKEISNRKENSYAYFTPIELGWSKTLYGYNPLWDQQGNQSELIVQLIPIGDLLAAHQVKVKTTIGSLIVRHKDSSESYVNVSSVATARAIAIRKGIKKLFKDCKVKTK
jgi:hypothetical protein